MITSRILITVAGLALVYGLWAHHQSIRSQLEAATERLSTCQASNRENERTIQTLERAEQENTEQYEAALQAMADTVRRLQEREPDGETEIIEIVRAATGAQCADLPMPDNLRVRVNRPHRGVPDHH